MIKHEETARALFKSGYNCAQSVFLAFSDVTGLDEKTAVALSSSFGGGMGRLREVCGAVSGMLMVAGILWGPDDVRDHAAKTKHYALVQQLAGVFRDQNGSIICRDLLGLAHQSDSPAPEQRTEAYYKRRPCAEYVAAAARILDDMIKDKQL